VSSLALTYPKPAPVLRALENWAAGAALLGVATLPLLDLMLRGESLSAHAETQSRGPLRRKLGQSFAVREGDPEVRVSARKRLRPKFELHV
jgi:hypothetical protein